MKKTTLTLTLALVVATLSGCGDPQIISTSTTGGVAAVATQLNQPMKAYDAGMYYNNSPYTINLSQASAKATGKSADLLIPGTQTDVSPLGSIDPSAIAKECVNAQLPEVNVCWPVDQADVIKPLALKLSTNIVANGFIPAFTVIGYTGNVDILLVPETSSSNKGYFKGGAERTIVLTTRTDDAYTSATTIDNRLSDLNPTLAHEMTHAAYDNATSGDTSAPWVNEALASISEVFTQTATDHSIKFDGSFSSTVALDAIPKNSDERSRSKLIGAAIFAQSGGEVGRVLQNRAPGESIIHVLTGLEIDTFGYLFWSRTVDNIPTGSAATSIAPYSATYLPAGTYPDSLVRVYGH